MHELKTQATRKRSGDEASIKKQVEPQLQLGNQDRLGGRGQAVQPQGGADRASAATGSSFSAGELHPLSELPGASALGGPIQAKKPWKESKPDPETLVDFGNTDPGYEPNSGLGTYFARMNRGASKAIVRPERANLGPYIRERFQDESVYGDALQSSLRNASGTQHGGGLKIARLLAPLTGSFGDGMSNEQIGDLYQKLLVGGRYSQLRQMNQRDETMQAEFDSYTPEQVANMDATMSEGTYQLKGMYYRQLKLLQGKYGTYGSQMHPDDFMKKAGPEFFDDTAILQDSEQMIVNMPMYFDFTHSEEDREFKRLSDYYNDTFSTIGMYCNAGVSPEHEGEFKPDAFMMDFLENSDEKKRMLAAENEIGGPGFTPKEMKGYKSRVKSRMKKNGMRNRLFGRFK